MKDRNNTDSNLLISDELKDMVWQSARVISNYVEYNRHDHVLFPA